MADDKPKRLDEYCERFGLSFFDVKLPCLFCNFELDLQELAEFHLKTLSLIWKDNACFAACKRCIRLSARFERENYCRCSVPSDAIENVTGQKLCELTIRCYLCYKRLDQAEKIDCIAANEDFLLIRHHWRGVCRFCARK